VNLIITVDDAKLQASLAGYSSRLITYLAVALDRFSALLQARVKEKLSDDVLHVRTGTLRRSINRSVTAMEDGVEAVVGTNIEYAPIHEYGFHGEVSVREHARRITTGSRVESTLDKIRIARTMRHGELGPASRRTRFVNGVSIVKAHTMQMNMPERSFLRSALRELEAVAVVEVRRAAVAALENQGEP
jgi:phage gpG-like protein